MIQKPFDKNFKDPNFQCLVEDSAGTYKWITYASSRKELRDRLRAQGYVIVQIRKYNFRRWISKANVATQKAIESHAKKGNCDFNPNIWNQLKMHLFELFNQKCAYCESKVLHVSYGEVEHFRPKRKVFEDPQHPGYYWLAYDVHNLLPVCAKCNEARAKMTHFPVKGSRAYSPKDNLRKEERLLLTPYYDSVEKDLYFPPAKNGVYFGSVEGLSEKGKKSVRVYNLNRAPLQEIRKKAQENVVTRLEYYLLKNRETYKEIWKEIINGVSEYSAAILSQANSWWKELSDCTGYA